MLFSSLHTQVESIFGPLTTISDICNAGGALDGDFYVQKEKFSRVKKEVDLLAMNRIIRRN